MQTTAKHKNIRFYHRPSVNNYNNNNNNRTLAFKRFEYLLDNYFASENPQIIGLPSVVYFADKLNLSPNYFGDLIKKTTGKSPREYIRDRIISVAKHRIFYTDLSISEIAYQLGFTYPQHFMRLFKQQMGYTPSEYRLKACWDKDQKTA